MIFSKDIISPKGILVNILLVPLVKKRDTFQRKKIPLVKKKDTFGQEKGYLCVWKPLPRKVSRTPKKVLEKLFKKVKEKNIFFLF